MSLEGQRIVLRPFEREDTGFVEGLLNGWEAFDLYRLDPLVWTSEDIRQQFNDMRSFIVGDRGSGLPLGIARIVEHCQAHRRAEIGGYLVDKHRNSGAGKEACALLLRYCFDYMDLARVETRVFATNVSSLAFTRRMGFREEGVLRSYLARGGQRVDLVVFGLLDHEFRGSEMIQSLLVAETPVPPTGQKKET